MTVRNLFSWNNTLSVYAKRGMLKPARMLFDLMSERDVVSWNTMVIAHAKHGFFNEALEFYTKLRRSSLIHFNEFSFGGVLIACVKMENVGLTRQVHGQVLVTGFLSNIVLSSSLVDSYAKCGVLDYARSVFDEMKTKDVFAWTILISGYAKWGNVESARMLFNEMPEPNSVSWSALIDGYVRSGMEYEALNLFSEMTMKGIMPDEFTFSSCLCACASIASLKHALALHGLGEEAIQLYDDMMREETKPNKVTLVVMLNACSHSGLVEEGIRFYESMTRDYGIVANQEHYACLVDLFGRAGEFGKVKNLFAEMSCKPDGQVWNALLGACRIHGNIELGRIAAKHLIELEPQSSAAYTLLSNIYAADGRWESVGKLRHTMNEREVRKEQAISWLDHE
ncbi:hypothetical protein GIB67_040840 [Kingdonia uniflora]|uniref:Pentatricopeptide repeat-containing protein n=1 Tax=Kingdonia uniflora TaxID=39325 RepID=A0A7J7P4H4_9MAGN|nr:hypothetical protein GIB67_040840 [Kingdonia uniflora]